MLKGKISTRLWMTVIIMAVLLALILFVKHFFLDFYRIQGSSMEPTLTQGKVVFLDKSAYRFSRTPQVGDMVIYPLNNRYVIKRCVATEGTELEYSVKSGYNLIVGEKIYPLSEKQYHYMYLSKRVPEGTVLCIGDNYSSSIDSRNYGFVPVSDIIGKIIWKRTDS